MVVSVGEGEVGLEDEIAEERIGKVEDVSKVDDEEDGGEAISLGGSNERGEGGAQLAVDPGAKSGF